MNKLSVLVISLGLAGALLMACSDDKPPAATCVILTPANGTTVGAAGDQNASLDNIQVDVEVQLANATIGAQQRLKGSCPFVFAFDGKEMKFVADFLWRSPLGLRINALDTAGHLQTEDWIKIGGKQLKPRDGRYEIRITAELWETHFFDHVSLLAVDHPADREIFVDERFAHPQPPLAVTVTSRPHPIGRVWDHLGRSVAELTAERDGR